MKKFLLIICLLFMPLEVFAYSKEIYLGGNTLGIELDCDGILVVGFYQIDGKYNKGNPNLKIGDYITKVNNVDVNSLNDLTNEIEKYTSAKEVTITYKRNDKIYKTELPLIEEEGVFKTGLYVKDSITGIGTLTYIDPGTNIYGALGHEIIESNSKKLVEIKDGIIFRNEVISIDRSKVGEAGSKNAKYYYSDVYGSIDKNTNHGIFGTYDKGLNNLKLVEVGNPEEIILGDASLYTVLENEKIEEFKIKITKINNKADTKNITFEIIDQKLLEKTGGVIQGMSGSPIMQNNKIIGVVTHVIVDNPTSGYGLFITKMLEEGEKNMENN